MAEESQSNDVIRDSVQDIYRNELATVDRQGNRIWIYPKKPKGKFYQYRKYLSYILLAVLFGLPFIKYNGDPLVMFNIPNSKFIILGSHFTPQDFHLFVIGMLILIVFIILFTVVFGRLFCGWICPQTIFMEMVFRRIEYWIEGDSRAQKKLNDAPWTNEKIYKKTIKHILFLLVSAFITHIFLSYIIGVNQLYTIVTEPISQHIGGFVAMVVFTLVFYGVFSVLREQVCTTICPYGRLQGVMLDENSLAVSYDFVRGEPRGKIKKKKKTTPALAIEEGFGPELEIDEPKLGDCIDCKLCVQVCPTGIDIRNGTQLECVNCTACMDACDEVMTKVKRPMGLIRIDSNKSIVEGRKKLFTPRVIAYTGVLLALISLESFLLFNRSDVETLILRTPGMLYQEHENDYISNLYNYQLINKSEKEMNITFKVKDIEDVIIEPVGKGPRTIKDTNSEGAMFIKIPRKGLDGRKTVLKVEVYGDDELIDVIKTSFLGPI